MNKRWSVVFFMLITLLLSAQNSLIRMPRISPNAQEMAFSYQGDIWIHNFNTQQSKRLTIHEGMRVIPFGILLVINSPFLLTEKELIMFLQLEKLEEYLNN